MYYLQITWQHKAHYKDQRLEEAKEQPYNVSSKPLASIIRPIVSLKERGTGRLRKYRVQRVSRKTLKISHTLAIAALEDQLPDGTPSGCTSADSSLRNAVCASVSAALRHWGIHR